MNPSGPGRSDLIGRTHDDATAIFLQSPDAFLANIHPDEQILVHALPANGMTHLFGAHDPGGENISCIGMVRMIRQRQAPSS
ncbi:MAG: hypothetical protein M0T86_06605 [Betaproteobacteria bacterium]|nr:hypothetical protein [Betaproteobacteria bacterium]